MSHCCRLPMARSANGTTDFAPLRRVRKTVRQARAKPLLDSMHTWLEAALAKLSRKSDTAAAIRYALSRWPALTRYVDDGALEIDNNAAERALRVVALGRKNYLFAGSNAGGDRAAAIYSLLASAKLNGLDPEIYLHTSSNASPNIPSTGSTSCCHGTYRSPTNTITPKYVST